MEEGGFISSPGHSFRVSEFFKSAQRNDILDFFCRVEKSSETESVWK